METIDGRFLHEHPSTHNSQRSLQHERHIYMQPWAHSIQAIAFDMDGLMVNTEELYTIVGHTILQRRDRKFTTDLKDRMTGLPGPVAWQLMIDLEQLSDTIDELELESKQIFAELLPQRLAPMPGLFELLDLLDARELPRCVATSSTRPFADQVLQQIGALDRVDFVVTAADVARGKPWPDIYLSAAERMGTQPANMLVLEDSHHGSQAGLAAGTCTVAVPGEHSLHHDFSGVYARAASLHDPLIASLLPPP
ncbi:HAD family hydrolase [Aureliella helgolandensis]|uniref:Phosphorylated carbohydrates phosphatase n=1 Tax=Aureliella helgolandensis TaxID=2527968 RepID=A0A518GGH0_9BACT|nr:HAD family phosphatase [Aureliella helgolandensis]QDV27689.1 Phosphorylated carbohydrates phosphatase [Aureliella helgolandensis]